MRRRPKILAALAAVALPMTVTGVSSPGGPPLPTVDAPVTGRHGAGRGVPRGLRDSTAYRSRCCWRCPTRETRWDDHQGTSSTSGGYGPMHLTAVDPTAVVDLLRRAQGRQDRAHSRTLYKRVRADRAGPGCPAQGRRREHRRRCRAAGVVPALARPPGRRRHVRGRVVRRDRRVRRTRRTGRAHRLFADDVYAILAKGAARTTNTGQQVVMPAAEATPDKDQLARTSCRCRRRAPAAAPRRSARSSSTASGCRRRTRIRRRSATTATTTWRTGRTTGKIDYIIIHDTEGGWQGTLNLVQDPTYVSWQYTMRSSDGHTWQHVKANDVAWHAGNWYVNMHSIGIEHEGFAAQGATWYTEALYRNSAKLVRYLAAKNNIPLDRAHIIGHDQIPGTIPSHGRAACTGTRDRTGTGSATSTCSARRSRASRCSRSRSARSSR